MQTWTIDNRVNLTKSAEKAEWHLATIIAALVAQGIERRDAEAFANFACNEYATENNGVTDHASEECVSDEQWGRLSLGAPETPEPKQMTITADWDGEKYIACYGVMIWVSDDGDEWRDSRTAEFPNSPEFQNCAITLVGGPRDGETVG